MPTAPPGGAEGSAGRTYFVKGSTLSASSGLVDLGTLTTGEGTVILGADVSDRSGNSVSAIGDLDGDGLTDFVVGGYLADVNGLVDAGEAYVVYGSAMLAGGTIDLGSLAPEQGITIQGAVAGGRLGTSVTGVDDMDGDAVPDVVIGAPYTDKAYLISGTALQSSGGTFDLATAVPGAEVVVFNGNGIEGFRAGFALDTINDLDSDGLPEIVIGANDARDPAAYTNREGATFVVCSCAITSTTTSINLATMPTTTGTHIIGGDGDKLGYYTVNAGDVTGDGLDDLLISARWSGEDGGAYLIYGSGLGPSTPDIDLQALTASQGVYIDVPVADRNTVTIAAVGDLDGDGLADILVGAQSADPDGKIDAGEAWLIYGSALVASGGSIDVTTLTPSQGVLIKGADAGDEAGSALAGIGDVNGDGILDIMVGARRADGLSNAENDAGESFVLSGALLLAEKLDDGIIDLADPLIYG